MQIAEAYNRGGGVKNTVTDQMGRVVVIPVPPQRIISLVPSQTELLFYLGLDEEIIGVTKFCIHPSDHVQLKQLVGGTKQLKLDVIDHLQPDLILGSKEENSRDDITKLAERYSVWMSDVVTLEDALDMIRSIGRMVARSEAANALASQISASFAELQPLSKRPRVGYFIWNKPLMAAGANTFINDILGHCGLENAFAAVEGRYPEVDIEDLGAAELDAILLSSEPFPFKEKHRAALAEQFPAVGVYLVDGEMFSWYGSRLRWAPCYLKDLIGKLDRETANNE